MPNPVLLLTVQSTLTVKNVMMAKKTYRMITRTLPSIRHASRFVRGTGEVFFPPNSRTKKKKSKEFEVRFTLRGGFFLQLIFLVCTVFVLGSCDLDHPLGPKKPNDYNYTHHTSQ